MALLKAKHKKKSKHNQNKLIKYIKLIRKKITITRIQKTIGRTSRFEGGK
jgi:hypothetical protein